MICWKQSTIVLILTLCCSVSVSLSQEVDFQQQHGSFVIIVDGEPIATYVYQDENIPRPYFAHVKAPGGQQVTRNFPPIEGQDATDHDTMHPGIWMAFGDLDGNDFWRNKAKIVHDRFATEPKGGLGHGCFVEEKQYRRDDGTLVCRERFRCDIEVHKGAYLLLFDSTFDGDQEFYFGDQEEMGVGFRVATALTETNGGHLTDSEGRRGADSIWSQAAKWCDYSGRIDDRHLGMTLLCHTDNFRPSWMHARAYGFCAGNLFGRQAMKKGDLSRVTVAAGEKLRLRYGIWIHSDESEPKSVVETVADLETVYADYLQSADSNADCL